LCDLEKSHQKLAYYGVFGENVCKSEGVVCGINGVTYKSECEAFSDYSIVDYYGPCKAFGLIDTHPNCANVKCPKTLPENCLGIIPTGACCPICGGALKIMYSRKQIDRGIYALKNFDLDSLTLRSLLKSLQRLVKVSSCYLAGFLTVETDIMVIIRSIHENPTSTETEVCQQEALKITNLITTKSHHLTSDLGLSSFIVANYIKPSYSFSLRLFASHSLILIASFLQFILCR
jgi:reversion-inducing-cysteine-rich protein with kazal motifs